MKAPNKCPVCGAKKEWKLVDKNKHGNAAGALVGGIVAHAINPVGTLAGALIGNALGKGKKSESYVCAKCGFSHTYVD